MDAETRNTEKPVKWVGSSLKDPRAMPEEVKDEFGFVLGRVQEGKGHRSLKPLSGFRGVQQIRLDQGTDAYRLAYVANLPDAIYVLHVFKKKSRTGISTPRHEVDVIHTRLNRAKEASSERG